MSVRTAKSIDGSADVGDRGPERVGVILVHGIGEQRRFEHLDWQGRDLINALRKQGLEVTVEIASGPTTVFHAEQDTWSDSPNGAVRALVGNGQRITHCFHFHEVWWADVNERYSVAKQIRFWLWGLAVWAYPPGRGSYLPHVGDVTSPAAIGHHELWNRTRLFLVGVFFLVAAFPAGIGLLLLQRMFNLRTPNLLRTLTSYVSGVKLFNQRSRYGPSFSFRPSNDDFLDTLHEPPRVSIRRRMIRTIAAVARAEYDRWYIVAHSQGTVPAFNGLMESPHTWPGYFDESTWRAFCGAGFGGPGAHTGAAPPGTPVSQHAMPRRPIWTTPDEIAYRAQIFQRFAGLLTLGSPLEKFAAIWPARVPISRIPAFRKNTAWINVFDPLDPVSGVLEAYRTPTAELRPVDVGYTASPVLLLAHLRYTSWLAKGCLADGIAKWLLTADPAHVLSGKGRFKAVSTQCSRRTFGARVSWLGAFAFFSVIGGWSFRAFLDWLLTLRQSLTTSSVGEVVSSSASVSRLREDWDWLWQLHSFFWMFGVIGVSVLGTLCAGAISYRGLFRGNEDSPAPPPGGQLLRDPDTHAHIPPPWRFPCDGAGSPTLGPQQ